MSDGRRPVRYDSDRALRELAAADPRLGMLIARAGPYELRLKSAHSPFESLLESIIYQQLHGKAAAAILKRVLALSGGYHPLPEELLRIPPDRLRGAGLSGNKLAAIRDLAEKTVAGTVPTLPQIRRMKDEQIIERLTEVRGIGQWTVEMLLIFRLGKPDVLPVSDYGVRKGFALTFAKRPPKWLDPECGPKPLKKSSLVVELPKADVMLRRAERWRPWRSVATWYLWRACDLAPR